MVDRVPNREQMWPDNPLGRNSFLKLLNGLGFVPARLSHPISLFLDCFVFFFTKKGRKFSEITGIWERD